MRPVEIKKNSFAGCLPKFKISLSPSVCKEPEKNTERFMGGGVFPGAEKGGLPAAD